MSRHPSFFLYSIYGKSIQSDWELCLPQAHSGTADIRVIKADRTFNPKMPLQISRGGTNWVELPNGSLFLEWRDLFEFMVSADGGIISVHSLGCQDRAILEILLLGPVISFALLKFGIEHIHATAVVINDAAIAFTGDSTFGKSTLAASFLQAGHRILTDDLLVVKSDGGRIWAYPGPQRIKLFPGPARDVLGIEDQPSPSSLTPKLLIPLNSEQFQNTETCLKTIYVLNCPASRPGSRITIRKASQRNACIHMLRNNYNTVIMSREGVTGPFALSTMIAAAVPVKTLSYARDFASLTQVRDAILADVAR